MQNVLSRIEQGSNYYYFSDVVDIQPLVGMSLGNVREVFEQLCRQYGSDAVLSKLVFDGNYPCVEVEVPID